MENTMNNRNEIPQQVKQVVSIAETLLQGQILGMYLYGSATMNKLRPDSDIQYFGKFLKLSAQAVA